LRPCRRVAAHRIAYTCQGCLLIDSTADPQTSAMPASPNIAMLCARNMERRKKGTGKVSLCCARDANMMSRSLFCMCANGERTCAKCQRRVESEPRTRHEECRHEIREPASSRTGSGVPLFSKAETRNAEKKRHLQATPTHVGCLATRARAQKVADGCWGVVNSANPGKRPVVWIEFALATICEPMASAGAVPLPIRGFRIWEGSCADRQGSRLSSKKICRVISVAKALVSGSLASGSTDVFRSCKRVETRPLDDSGLTLGSRSKRAVAC
jgi:hypothetical protein